MGKRSLIQYRKRLLPDERERPTVSFTVALPGYKTIPVGPMSHRRGTGRHWLGEEELVARVSVSLVTW